MIVANSWQDRLKLPRIDVEDLYLAKCMFLDIRSLMERNPLLQRRDYFHTFHRMTYLAHISTLLRRNLTRNPKGSSFLSFLDSVAAETKGSKDSVIADIAELEGRAKLFKGFFDKQVAHLDKQRPTSLPTYNDLHETIDLLTDLCHKYSEQLVGDAWSPGRKEIGDEWLTIFDSPWYDP